MPKPFAAPAIVLAAVLFALVLGACSGDAPSDDLPLADRLTQQAGTPATTIVAPPPVAATPSSTSASMPTDPPPTPAPPPDAATVLQVRTLGTLVLTEADLPADYVARSRQPAYKSEIVLAQIAIPKLANYFEDSDLRGSWVTLFTNPGPPETGVSSIIYLFLTPEDARGLVDTAALIGVKDYLSATEAQVLPSPPVGDAAALLRYSTLNGNSLELTWAQGPLVGQIILRAAAEPPGAVDLLMTLAQIQAERMASFLP